MTCTFFGHSDSPNSLEPQIEAAILDLIENHGVNRFYVGTHGSFDRMCFSILKNLSEKYPIDYAEVYSAVSIKSYGCDDGDYSHKLIPDGIEKALPKFRINYRNRWMIKHSQYVVTYIINPFGTGAALYAEEAEKKGKKVIKLGKY